MSLTLVTTKNAIDVKASKQIEVPANSELTFKNDKLYMKDGREIKFKKNEELDFLKGENFMFTCYQSQLKEILAKFA